MLLSEFAALHQLTDVSLQNKGRTARIYRANNQLGKTIAIKAVHEKNRRNRSIEREVEFLQQLRPYHIGPELYSFDTTERVILMEWIEGVPLRTFILDLNPPPKQLQSVIQQLLLDAQQLDRLGIDHGQLAGKGHNVLVKIGKKNLIPIIIDFEKASRVRKPHNFSQLASWLYYNPRGVVSQRLKKVLGPNWFSQILK